jgi:hypothetical protein
MNKAIQEELAIDVAVNMIEPQPEEQIIEEVK